MLRIGLRLSALVGLAGILSAGPAAAQAVCQNTVPFPTWLEGFKRDAAAQGISQRTLAVAFRGVTYDPGVIARDRNQRIFKLNFEQFSARLISRSRLQRGAGALRRYGRFLNQIEQRYGVPGPVVIALWSLESNFGSFQGKMSTLRSLATLAYDCRRSQFFRGQLMDALRIIDRGDLSPAQMRGAWAGELGQTQFMPSSYVKYAVDGDGNGRRDLIRSVPDALASTANYLRSYGWQAGQPWTPGTTNFQVLQQWNNSEVYTRTVAHYASLLAGTQARTRAVADRTAPVGRLPAQRRSLFGN